MIPELGHFALWLAVGVTLALGTVPLVGAQRGRGDWMALARPMSQVLLALITFSFACLVISFVNNDFSVLNVAEHSNSALPMMYRVAASWGSHEGSLVLWLLMQAAWTSAVAVFSRNLPQPMLARILAVMGWLTLTFLLFVLLTSNPFERLFPTPLDGRDLNPQLQDPGMIFHPPMLYMGYVGMSVAFAFAVAALIGGNLDAQWARWSRPWVTVAWAFLTFGIALGSWWAYYELGWGGWWFWDAVENASFMPWLVATALIHSLAVTEKRGSFKAWTVLLALSAYSLSLLGTFLVRSGVITSVHSFASDPARGLFILIMLAITVGVALTLFAWRAPSVGLGARFSSLSRETLLLANNVLLVVATAAVMLGTLYPLILDALNLGKISVGAPYFDAVFVPIMAVLVFFMGVGPLARWKNDELPALAKRLRWAAGVTVVSAALTAWLGGKITLMSVVGLLMAFWVLTSVATEMWERVRPAGGVRASVLNRLGQVPRAVAGMWLAHLGVAVFIFGVTMVGTHDIERDVAMSPGDSTTVNGYTFTYMGAQPVQGPNYQAVRGHLAVTKGGQALTDMYPEKRVYRVQRNPMTEAAIHTRIHGDLYVQMGEVIQGQTWLVRIWVKPFVSWIWAGCLLMGLGGVLAVTDQRYRSRSAAANRVPASSGELAPGQGT
ncbi:MAG: heme lyase CcmF/NrfE family subunit [Rubrivivax sp.]|nr:heme lyase CcmF/NrfE family subunit [Rubrivivax sp.]